MKIRNGFVSNSSSSSFVIRGILVENKEENFWQENYSRLEKSDLVIQDASYYFDTEKSTENNSYIIGCSLLNLDDGVVEVIPDPDPALDQEIIEKLIKAGFDVDKSMIKTYAQYVSNDNF